MLAKLERDMILNRPGVPNFVTKETVNPVNMDLMAQSSGPTESNVPDNLKNPKARIKYLRNRGKSYTTKSRKSVAQRKMGILQKCRENCASKITHQQQKTLFDHYWSLSDYNKRLMCMLRLIVAHPTKHKTRNSSRNRAYVFKYHVIINTQKVPVCRECFKKIFGESEGFLKTVLRKLLNLTDLSDQRGKHSPKNKLSDEVKKKIIDHINSFPRYQSHYTRRHTNKLYLSPDLDVKKLYKMFQEKHGTGLASYSSYYEEFNKMNLSFKIPKLDACHKCEIFQAQLVAAQNSQEFDKILKEQVMHHKEADLAYETKKLDKASAKNTNSLAVCTFDLQQCLPTPYLRTSASFYKRSLWTYNLTVFECTSKESTCSMWYESLAGRGGIEIGSCLLKYINSLPPDVKNIIFYSDSCGGQNKNSIVATMFMIVVACSDSIETIEHKFFAPGHSHMECDTVHARIEKTKKRTNLLIHHPDDWMQLVRSVGPKNKVEEMFQSNFKNFAATAKSKFVWRKTDSEKNRFLWKNVKWMRYSKNIGLIEYKNSLNEDEPFKTFNIKKRGADYSFDIDDISQCRETLVPISKEKYSDIMEMLPVVNPRYHDFYKSLPFAGCFRRK